METLSLSLSLVSLDTKMNDDTWLLLVGVPGNTFPFFGFLRFKDF